jgi:hypothetical protein
MIVMVFAKCLLHTPICMPVLAWNTLCILMVLMDMLIQILQIIGMGVGAFGEIHIIIVFKRQVFLLGNIVGVATSMLAQMVWLEIIAKGATAPAQQVSIALTT